MRIKFLEHILDAIDEKKKQKALSEFPYCYIDRHGKKWFNNTYCCGFGILRKWM